MWLIEAVVGGIFILFVGFTVLPAFVSIMTSFDTELVSTLPGLTAFESVVMKFYPIAIFLAVLFAGILYFIHETRKKEGG